MTVKKNNGKEEEVLRKKLEMIANIRKQHEWIAVGQTEVNEADNIEQELEKTEQRVDDS
jgi:hypothetical protein